MHLQGISGVRFPVVGFKNGDLSHSGKGLNGVVLGWLCFVLRLNVKNPIVREKIRPSPCRLVSKRLLWLLHERAFKCNATIRVRFVQ